MLAKELLHLDPLEVLLKFKFFLHVLVSLEELAVLKLSHVTIAVLFSLALLSQGVHLLRLLLDEEGLSSNDLLNSDLGVLLLLFSFELNDLGLHLLCFSVLLLPG